MAGFVTEKHPPYWRHLARRALTETLARARLDTPWTAIFGLGPTVAAGIGAWAITGNATWTAIWSVSALAALSLLYFLYRLVVLPKQLAQEAATAHLAELHAIRGERDGALFQLAVLMPGEREAFLARAKSTIAQLASFYIASHDGISSAMLAGMELPPEQWLNAELERCGQTWRVRNVQGDKYDIVDG